MSWGITEVSANCFGVKTAQESLLKNHITQHHTLQKEFKCEQCTYVGASIERLRLVFIFYHSSYWLMPWINEIFRKLFHRKHLEVHNTEKKFKCPDCNFKTHRQRNLKNHRKVHQDERPWICEYCNKGFKEKQNLVTHIYTHTGEKPYKCDHCEYACNTPSNLTKHKKNKHK